MRVGLSRRGTLPLVIVYTLCACLVGFGFCTVFYCRQCQMGSMTRDELTAKLASAARKLGFESVGVDKEEHESMPKPPENFEAYGSKGLGRTHSFTGGKGCPIINSPLIDYLSPAKKEALTVQQKSLALCGQKAYLPIDEFFTPLMRRSLKKLGEGVFGEVYSAFNDEAESLAMKIMPIDGPDKINDERQKTFEEILPEMVISKELSDLGKNMNARYYTKNFVQLSRMGICIGEYPDFLLYAWDQYDEDQDSDNDRPDIFNGNQLFVVFAFENSGHALESFVFHSQDEARSVIAQIAGTLAVGEEAVGFEHRDMHRGNILVKRSRELEDVVFIIDSVKYTIPSYGVKVTIIDYSLSRIQQGECVSFNDLNNLPWLFEGKEGLQHSTYLKMRNFTAGDWSRFTPQSNAHWLHYIVNRMASKSKVKNLNRRHIYGALRPFLDKFTQCNSAKQVFMEYFSKPAMLLRSKKKRPL